MVVDCPVCREVVHTSGGYILDHGQKHHGRIIKCIGSGSKISCDVCA